MRSQTLFVLIQLRMLLVSAQAVSTLFLYPGQAIDSNLYNVVNCIDGALNSSATATIAPTSTVDSYTTVTIPFAGTDVFNSPSTVTLAGPQGTTPGIVEVIIPRSYVTTTLPYPGSDSIASPVTVTVADPSGANPGTVAVLTPTGVFTSIAAETTITLPYTGTDNIFTPITTTLAPGLIGVFTPVAPLTTLTLPYTGADPINAPITTNLAPGVVGVLTPGVISVSSDVDSFVTIIVPSTGAIDVVTTTIAQPSGTIPGTVEILTPTSAPLAGFVTFTAAQVGTGIDPITSTVALPSGTSPGTIVILTPTPISTSTPAPYVPPADAQCGVSGSFCISVLSAQLISTGVCTDLSNCPAQAAQLAYANGATSYAILGPTFYFFNDNFQDIQNILNAIPFLSLVCGIANPVLNAVFYDTSCIPQASVYCNLPGTPLAVAGTGNKGLSYALYVNPYDNTAPFGDGTNGYTAYQEDSFIVPIWVGQTNELGFNNDDGSSSVAIYPDEAPIYSTSYKTLIHQGYVFARTTGTYTFTSTYSDDITLLWTGNNAYSGYSRSNADLVHTFPDGVQQPISFSVDLTQGDYLPVRIQWGNGGPPAGFQFSISGPSGVLMDSTGSTDVVTLPCSGSILAFVGL